jgi:hypothetical protein
MYHSKKRSRFTADRVGMEVIDHVDHLDGRALPILHVLIGELVKQSKNGGRQR